MATYKVKAYGKEYTVEVIEQSGGARIIVEGYSFEVEQAAPGSVPGQSAARTAVVPRPAAPAPAVTVPAGPPAKVEKAKGGKGAKAAPAAAPAAAAPAKAAGGRGAVVAPIPGVITKVCVAEGDQVKAGDVVVKLEAMKMENDIMALTGGTVKQVAVAEGNEVSDGQLLVLIE